jgi:AcrR family transcriptional regulator
MKKKGEAARAKLIKGALHVLETEGVFGVTTRKISDASGQGLAALHYYFKDRDDLLFAVLEEEVAVALSKHLKAEVKDIDDLESRAEALIRSIWRFMKQTRAMQLLQFEMTFYAVRGADTAWLAEKQYARLREQYETFLDGPDVSDGSRQAVRNLARFIIAGLDGALIQDLAVADETQAHVMLECLVNSAMYMARQIKQQPS